MGNLEQATIDFLQKVDDNMGDHYYNRGRRVDPLIVEAFDILKEYYRRDRNGGTIHQHTHELELTIKELKEQVVELENEIADLHSTGEY